MNWVDIVILVVWAGTASWGASMGLLRMGVHLATVVVGLAVSSRIAESLSGVFAPLTDNENAQTVAAFIAI
ncbi:MAG: CvpA family protein, partial [Chloroflexi bacterium]|nr:CvpA family protein [Chloroflexota bacterium]MCI0825216.1 CvpA family protein [Chloroflexota bacterium]MCI0860125.1 CvpA family protein [Chloroflexota bacterium]